jgi:hypothetical protein
MMMAEESGKSRSLMIAASSSSDGTDVSLTAIENQQRANAFRRTLDSSRRFLLSAKRHYNE